MSERYLEVLDSNVYFLPMIALQSSDLEVGLHICVIKNELSYQERADRAEHFRVTHPPFMHEDARTIEPYVIVDTLPNSDSGIPGKSISRMLPLSYLGISLDSGRSTYRRERYSVSYSTLLAFPRGG